jgi:hypothetical protein
MKTKIHHTHVFCHRGFIVTVSVLAVGTFLAAFASSAFSNSAGRQKAKSVSTASQSGSAMRTLPTGTQNFWTQTNGPQGGDGIALARNSIGDLFVGTQGGGVFR